MPTRSLARPCLLFLCAALLPAPIAAAGDQAARANGPAALGDLPGPADETTPGSAAATSPDADPEGRPAGQTARTPVTSTVPLSLPPLEPSALEMRSLGEPLPRSVGEMSDEIEAGGEASGSILPRWLDPRRNEVMRVGASLLAVIAVIVLARAAARRRGVGAMGGGGRPSGVLEVLARYPVGRGQWMVLLKLGRRVLLMHQSGQTMTTLSEIRDPDEVANLLGRLESGASGRASGWFRMLLRRYESEHEQAAQVTGDRRDERPAPGGGEVIDLTRGRRRPGRRLRQRSVLP